jgi:hypothetical protein
VFTRFSSCSVGPSCAQIGPRIGPWDRAHEGPRTWLLVRSTQVRRATARALLIAGVSPADASRSDLVCPESVPFTRGCRTKASTRTWAALAVTALQARGSSLTA